MKRWKVILEHRTDFGPVETEFDIEELDELPTLIERGPDWRSLIRCTITYELANAALTVEQAAQL